jgi:L-seryl-tRNA(Ser) seleniumtransferase
VTTSVAEATGLSNRTPSLRVWWNRQHLGFSGEAVARTLFETEPRIALPVSRNPADPASTGVSVTAYMLSPGDEKIIGDRLHSLLSGGMTREPIASPAAPAADLSGRWDVRIEYAAGVSTHAFHLRQRNNEIEGSHQGDFISRDLSGTIDGDTVRIRSFFSEQTGDSLSFTFSGKAAANEMSGALDMGEYLSATWKARRRGATGN